jgi:hypothetical protein
VTSLHVVYRACAAGNGKRRPTFFSKWGCLMSFLRATNEIPECDVTFLCDSELPSAATAAMRPVGHLEYLGGVGNSRSYLAAVARLTESGLDDESLVYLCEDDYLYLPDALATLVAAGRDLDPGGYLTLYDHPDRYRRDDDLAIPGAGMAVLGGHHWRQVESTNMTFGTHVGTLRRDHRLHHLVAAHTSYPHDRELWRTLQGLGIRRPVRWLRGERPLFGAIPSLATHMEAEQLAPAVQWEKVAAASLEWAESQEMAEAHDW